jgi:hypothetical protein
LRKLTPKFFRNEVQEAEIAQKIKRDSDNLDHQRMVDREAGEVREAAAGMERWMVLVDIRLCNYNN